MLGDKVKNLRKQKKLTQQELAKIVGLSQSTIGMIESNRQGASKETLIKLAKALDTTVDYLLSEEDASQKEAPIEKINKAVKKSKIETIAAHFEGEDFTDEDIEDIENFIRFILSKKKK